MHCKKTLRLADRFEPPHLSFPKPGGFIIGWRHYPAKPQSGFIGVVNVYAIQK